MRSSLTRNHDLVRNCDHGNLTTERESGRRRRGWPSDLHAAADGNSASIAKLTCLARSDRHPDRYTSASGIHFPDLLGWRGPTWRKTGTQRAWRGPRQQRAFSSHISMLWTIRPLYFTNLTGTFPGDSVQLSAS